MYRSFFGLAERPFDLTPNPRFLVLTDAHREALSSLEYGIASRRGITVLIGEAGTGKTTLIRTALQRQPQQVHSVHLQNPALTRAEFVEMLAIRFDLSERARVSKTALLTELEQVGRARHERGESTVLIVDEAQSMPLDLLEELRLLGNIETDDSKLMSIVLAGQPELAALLENPAIRQLKQRIALRCELRPLTQVESASYLAGRIRAAGGVGAQVFTREAVMLIHQQSGGIPRMVSVIADNALVTAFALGRKPVNSEIVREVCADLRVPPAEAVAATPIAMPAPAAEPAAQAVHRAAPGKSDQSRVLSVESTENEAAVQEKKSNSESAESEPGLFTSVFPKRRRFSLFSRSGS